MCVCVCVCNTWRASSLANLNERLARENEERVDLRRHIAQLVVVNAERTLDSQEQRLEMERVIGDLRTQLADTQAAELQYAAAASSAASKAELRIQVASEASKAAEASKTEELASEAARKSEDVLRMQHAAANLHTEAQRAGGGWGGSRMEIGDDSPAGGGNELPPRQTQRLLLPRARTSILSKGELLKVFPQLDEKSADLDPEMGVGGK